MSKERAMTGIAKLKAFGFGFNNDGELRKIDKITKELTDEPFSYMHASNRSNTEFGRILNEVLYDQLITHGLKRTYIPAHLPPKNASFFFAQPGHLRSSKKLLVLISGYAGKWSSELIVEKSLKHGSQLQYIKQAQALGYDLLIMNNFDNYRLNNGKMLPIQDLNDSSNHLAYIWEHYVLPAQPKSVAIVAYCNATQSIFDLAAKYEEFFKEKVFAIALLNAVNWHLNENAFKTIEHYTCNWIATDVLLDTEVALSDQKFHLRHLSAGLESKKDGVPYTALKSVFRFLGEKYGEFEAKRWLDK